MIPDFVIYNVLSGFLKYIREDYNNNSVKEESFLYRIFREQGLGDYMAFEQVIAMIITEPSSPKHIEVNMGWAQNKAKFPSIHISMPSEDHSRNNELGMGINEDDIDVIDNTVSYNFNRAYDTVYHVVVMSDNRSETVILYHMLKAVLTAAYGHFSTKGIRNMHLGGTDLNHDHRIPDGIYARAVKLGFDYVSSTPDWMARDLISGINVTCNLVVPNE